MREMRAEMRDGFRDLRNEMHAEFGDLRNEMHTEFSDLRSEDRSIRGELAQIKLFMLGGLVTILTAFIALHG
jgi:hypothetical protein